MSDYKIITNILPADCLYEIVQYFIHDLKTLYSCITVNRDFCQFIIPILWRNPFKFVLNNAKRVLIIRTYFSCLNEEEKSIITANFIRPTPKFPKPFIDYPNFLQEFEIYPIHEFMREFIRENIQFSTNFTRSKKVSSLTRELNPFMMKLFMNKQRNYKHVNIYLCDATSHAKNQMDISSLDDETIEHVLLNINKFSFGYQCSIKDLYYYSFIRNNITKLAKHVKDIQHLSIQTSSIISKNLPKRQIINRHNEIIETLKSLVLSLNNLKSFSTVCFWNGDEYLNMFNKLSNSLTFLKLSGKFRLLNSTVFNILNLCPNLKTLELFILSTTSSSSLVDKHVSQLNYLENLSITIIDNNILEIFERVLLMSNNNIKTLFLNRQTITSIYVGFQDYFILSLQPFLSNLSHFFLKIESNKIRHVISLLKTLKNLIHFKLGIHLNGSSLPIHEFPELPISLSSSLKILELDFCLPKLLLEVLLNDGKYNLTELSIYSTIIDDELLKVVMEYAKQRNSLTTFRYKKICQQSVPGVLKEARSLFMIDDNPNIFVNQHWYKDALQGIDISDKEFVVIALNILPKAYSLPQFLQSFNSNQVEGQGITKSISNLASIGF